MPYACQYSNEARKAKKKIPKMFHQGIFDAIALLKKDPYQYPQGLEPLQKMPKGWYRIRKGEFRILFYVNDSEKLIQIAAIRPRGSAYKF